MAVRDYSKGKIYKIVADTDEEYKPYVGSTIQGLAERMGGHRSTYKYWKKKGGMHTTSYDLFDKFGVDKCKIILLEEYSCENISQLLMKEREWFDKMECCNKLKPFASKEELVEYIKIYKQEHKEQTAEYNKQYREEHKELITEKAKEKYDCPCGSTICKHIKARHEKTLKHQNYLSSLKV